MRSDRPFVDEPWARHTLDSVSDGVLIVDERGALVYFNAAAERLVGANRLPAERATWSDAFGIFLPDERTQFPWRELPLVRALEGVATSDVELFVRNEAAPKGIHLRASAGPLHDEGGRVRGAQCFFHDTSLRRLHETEIAAGVRASKAILDDIPDMAWQKDKEGRFLAVNQPFAEAAGKVGPANVLGLTDLDLWPRDLAERYRGDDAEVMRTKQHKRVEEPLVDASGRVSWVETVKACIISANGEVIGTTGIARDITERKREEESLRLTKDELERRVAERTAELAEAQESLVRKERLAVLGQLAGGVAHQIRNPLAAIMNAAYVLKRHLAPVEHSDVDDAIRIIHDEVRHSNVIITGLLDYARVRTPDRHPASIVELVERALSGDWLSSAIRVERDIGDVPPLDLDADQMHGAIFNIVRNAAEAMPQGGTLRVEVRAAPDHVLVAVADDGPGISGQVRAHLFQPLHSTKPMGIGLGLVTARTFVEAHGGRISYVEVPKGARFEIRLPLT